MKFTLAWLEEHLDTDRPLSEIVDTLSMIGLEVEAVEDRGAALAGFRVAHVVSATSHPDADRLKVCMVDDGSGTPVQVVCGAPNARAGMKGIFAPAGSYIPGTGITLKKTKIRGQESNGMLLSEKELGLSDDHEGIVDLPEDTPAGAAATSYLSAADPVIEIALTPNRPDCAGVRGIARDLAAAGMGKLNPLHAPNIEGEFESPVKWNRQFREENADACPLVVGRFFRGVRNVQSPQWLQDRLRAIGLRPISALVDITNYVSYDLARPLHVFDANSISGDLTMRLAVNGEEVNALDGNRYVLDQTMTVIADDNGVAAIGGIMGGADSGCTDKTTDVFLEVALFDSVRTANTGRNLDILSDARYRFERGVDPESAYWGAQIATRLILEICGGSASYLVSAGRMPAWQREFSLRKSRVASLGGLEVPDSEQVRILDALGFDPVIRGNVIQIRPPSWRPDIDGEADIVEEVLRIRGYDNVPSTPMPRSQTVPQPAWSNLQQRESRIRRQLSAQGLTEAVTFSFMKRETAEMFGFANEALRVDNPISSDLDVMRPSILPNLLQAAQRNAARGYQDVALFEVGPIYTDDTEQGQIPGAAGVRVGRICPRHWSQIDRDVDLWDVKADAMAALQSGGAPVTRLQATGDAPAWYHPGRSGVLRLGRNVLASFGDIHPGVLRALNIAGPVVGFEINFNDVPTARKTGRPPLALFALQPVHRDLAFVADSNTPASDIVNAAAGVDRSLITDVNVFDVYEGLGDEKKSVAISLTIQPTRKTLTDLEIDALTSKIVRAVRDRTGSVLRE